MAPAPVLVPVMAVLVPVPLSLVAITVAPVSPAGSPSEGTDANRDAAVAAIGTEPDPEAGIYDDRRAIIPTPLETLQEVGFQRRRTDTLIAPSAIADLIAPLGGAIVQQSLGPASLIRSSSGV